MRCGHSGGFLKKDDAEILYLGFPIPKAVCFTMEKVKAYTGVASFFLLDPSLYININKLNITKSNEINYFSSSKK
jgi:hypothetical protein